MFQLKNTDDWIKKNKASIVPPVLLFFFLFTQLMIQTISPHYSFDSLDFGLFQPNKPRILIIHLKEKDKLYCVNAKNFKFKLKDRLLKKPSNSNLFNYSQMLLQEKWFLTGQKGPHNNQTAEPIPPYHFRLHTIKTIDPTGIIIEPFEYTFDYNTLVASLTPLNKASINK